MWDTLKTFGLTFGKVQGEIGEGVSLDEINCHYSSMGFPEGVVPYDTLEPNVLIDFNREILSNQCFYV